MSLKLNHNYYVYMTTNPNRTVLYTGVTNDLRRRLQEHFNQCGKKRTFAGRYYCYRLVYFEWYQDIKQAITREKQIKGWTRDKKNALIEKVNPQWNFASDPYFESEWGRFCGNV